MARAAESQQARSLGLLAGRSLLGGGGAGELGALGLVQATKGLLGLTKRLDGGAPGKRKERGSGAKHSLAALRRADRLLVLGGGSAAELSRAQAARKREQDLGHIRLMRRRDDRGKRGGFRVGALVGPAGGVDWRAAAGLLKRTGAGLPERFRVGLQRRAVRSQGGGAQMDQLIQALRGRLGRLRTGARFGGEKDRARAEKFEPLLLRLVMELKQRRKELAGGGGRVFGVGMGLGFGMDRPLAPLGAGAGLGGAEAGAAAGEERLTQHERRRRRTVALRKAREFRKVERGQRFVRQRALKRRAERVEELRRSGRVVRPSDRRRMLAEELEREKERERGVVEREFGEGARKRRAGRPVRQGGGGAGGGSGRERAEQIRQKRDEAGGKAMEACCERIIEKMDQGLAALEGVATAIGGAGPAIRAHAK